MRTRARSYSIVHDPVNLILVNVSAQATAGEAFVSGRVVDKISRGRVGFVQLGARSFTVHDTVIQSWLSWLRSYTVAHHDQSQPRQARLIVPIRASAEECCCVAVLAMLCVEFAVKKSRPLPLSVIACLSPLLGALLGGDIDKFKLEYNIISRSVLHPQDQSAGRGLRRSTVDR